MRRFALLLAAALADCAAPSPETLLLGDWRCAASAERALDDGKTMTIALDMRMNFAPDGKNAIHAAMKMDMPTTAEQAARLEAEKGVPARESGRTLIAAEVSSTGSWRMDSSAVTLNVESVETGPMTMNGVIPPPGTFPPDYAGRAAGVTRGGLSILTIKRLDEHRFDFLMDGRPLSCERAQ